MKDCVFCSIVNKALPSWKVFENDYAYAFFDIHPANKYHTLVIPKKHYKDIFDIPSAELKEVMAVVKKVAVRYRKKLGIENIQIINCSGQVAQQAVFHFHIHILPRYSGDGQDFNWKTKDTLVSQFDKLLSEIKKR